MPPEREDRVFAEGFRFSQEGHAVWPKILSDEMKPGACGYFNGDGDWVTIVQLTDTSAVKEILGLPTPASTTDIAPEAEATHRGSLNTTGVESVNTAPKATLLEGLKVKNVGGSTDWSEKFSNNVRRQAVELDGATVPPGTAAGAKAGIKYTCTTDRGAVLIARPPVSCARLTTESDLIDWVNKNIELLAHKGHWPSIKKRGLWVIRKTYHAPETAKYVFLEKDKDTKPHVGAKVPNIGDATASAAWWHAKHAGSGWIVHRNVYAGKRKCSAQAKSPMTWHSYSDISPSKDEAEADDKEDNLGVVVFFGGIGWRTGGVLSRRWKMNDERQKQESLGEDPNEPLRVFVKDPQVKASDSEEAYLEFLPGAVGGALPSDFLLPYNDSFEMYAEDSD